MREAIASLLKHIRKYYGTEGWKEMQDIIDGVNTSMGGDDCDYDRFERAMYVVLNENDAKKD